MDHRYCRKKILPHSLLQFDCFLFRHRQNWAALSPATRGRLENYARGQRSSSADDGHPPMPPRLTARTAALPTRARPRPELCSTRSEPDLRPMFASLDDASRWFVALYDYDHHMSPNANAAHDELSFRKHQLIKVRIG
jgi:hypothetical protein